MIDYQTKGYSMYGAQMGRRSGLAPDTAAELQIRRVPIDTGGYDPGGAYWGTGQPLFCVVGPDESVRYLRAASADEARSHFPNATFKEATSVIDADIEDMLQGYTECALWLSTDESRDDGGDPLDDNYSVSDIHPDTLAAMRRDCERFAHENAETLRGAMRERGQDWSLVGHDFWLTRNHHGCGFWDGDWPKEAGRLLTDAAHAFGDAYLFVGDDGKVHS